MFSDVRYPYQDSALPIEQRVDDLFARLTRQDKAALLFHDYAALADPNKPDRHGRPGAGQHLRGQGITHFAVQGAPDDARELVQWHNKLQEMALQHPLGIPVTLSSDPRHAVTQNPLTSNLAGAFSRWPEALGLAAIGDEEVAREHGDIVRREYIATGIRVALHPQVDLSTEPRWARIAQTFGEDADLSARLGVAYTRGLQGEAVGSASVSAMAKHFPGGGPQKDGLDPHFADGREQIYPGGSFDYHLRPFEALIKAGVAQMMPYYGMPVGIGYEEVGFSYNKAIITGLLREKLGFDGIVCTDFGVVTGMGDYFPARAWGVEHLSRPERIAKLLDAGVDQFGGETDVAVLLETIEAGLVSEERLEPSVRRLLREKFRLGLFDGARFVDADTAAQIVGAREHQAAGTRAQQDSLVLLQNDSVGKSPLLPLRRGIRVFAEGVDVAAFDGYAELVSAPEDADIAVIRLAAPNYADPRLDFLGSMHKGSLDFPDEVKARVRAVADAVPTVLDVYLDRPAILTDVHGVPGLFVSFGTDDRPFVEVLFGDASPKGTLPLDLPRSMAAVEASRTDVAFDTKDPIFRFGHGLRYA